MKTAAAGLLCLLMLGCSAAPPRPNIVVILADDLGFGDVGCYNRDSKIPTPNIDRLARQGRRFTDAHSPSAVCTPTRYGLLTGRYAWRTRLKRGVIWVWDPPLIKPDRPTLPAFLRDHGYHTGMVGKWHLGWNWPTTDGKRPKRDTPAETVDYAQPITDGPCDRGFDTYFGVDVPNFPPYCYIRNRHTIGAPTVQKPKGMFGRAGPMLKGWKLQPILGDLTKEAVAYIDRRAGAPFFLYFALTAPHTPIVPADRFKGMSGAGIYGDFVCEVDWAVGEVMKALRRNGVEENTLLIFTSDNGSPARDGTNASGPVGSVRRTGHDPSGGLRGLKGDIWEGGHRIPFIARWPGRIPAGTTSDETIGFTDLMRTCAAILGEPLPANAAPDGVNILPALLGEKLARPIREAIVHHSGNGVFAIRQGDWKLILGKGSGGFTRFKPPTDAPAGQLYNLTEDPAEQNNRYLQDPEIVKRLTALLDRYKREGRSRP